MVPLDFQRIFLSLRRTEDGTNRDQTDRSDQGRDDDEERGASIHEDELLHLRGRATGYHLGVLHVESG